MKTSYDRATDSLYIELRPLPAARTGYDIQHASDKRELVARLVLEEWPQAAE
ncbi:MAG: hypothetical protein WAS21_28365 [Geminicoccaceae bacterium]